MSMPIRYGADSVRMMNTWVLLLGFTLNLILIQWVSVRLWNMLRVNVQHSTFIIPHLGWALCTVHTYNLRRICENCERKSLIDFIKLVIVFLISFIFFHQRIMGGMIYFPTKWNSCVVVAQAWVILAESSVYTTYSSLIFFFFVFFSSLSFMITISRIISMALLT